MPSSLDFLQVKLEGHLPIWTIWQGIVSEVAEVDGSIVSVQSRFQLNIILFFFVLLNKGNTYNSLTEVAVPQLTESL